MNRKTNYYLTLLCTLVLGLSSIVQAAEDIAPEVTPTPTPLAILDTSKSDFTFNASEAGIVPSNQLNILGINGIMHFDEDKLPLIRDTRTLVPLKTVVDSLGARAEISPQDNSVEVRSQTNVLKFQINSKSYNANGISKEMDTIPYVTNQRVYVPIRYALEVFNKNVIWNGKSADVYTDLYVSDVAKYIDYEYVTSVGKLAFRTHYACGLAVFPGDIMLGKSGSYIKLAVPKNYTTQLKEVVAYVLRDLDIEGKDTFLDIVPGFEDAKLIYTTPTGTEYTYIYDNDNLVYITISSKEKSANQQPTITLAGEKLSKVSEMAYKVGDNVYAPLEQLLAECDLSLVSSPYASILECSNGTKLNVCSKMYTKNGQNIESNTECYILGNLLYINIVDFNNIFDTQFSEK